MKLMRRACATLLAIGLMSSCALAQDLLRVGKAGREAFSFVPVDIGVQMGFFKKRNLNVEIASFSGDARLQQAMAADAIDLSLASGPGMAFIVFHHDDGNGLRVHSQPLPCR
jgi:ABC-type nitrate/sulfonate/bicarbonate transport system substrate-binding protein